ncbi:hypothetical protein QUO_4026 [Clostridioides difficile P64]|uniref:hypothetical protein n=1 Tax=Clostridioides difficile TaxID=1496 RepID=UPI0003B1CD2C|nr:hypothetical protein [Clostridioides difficile]ERM32034.1 hypothetical protein QUO_4026 [Clostridioides difficile P64]
MEGTKRSYRKIPKLDLRKVKLADVFEKNKSGVFRVEEADEQLLHHSFPRRVLFRSWERQRLYALHQWKKKFLLF